MKIAIAVALLLFAPAALAADAGALVCPSSVPTDGGACSGSGTCEYGGDAHGLCSTFASCAGGLWKVYAPTPDCETSAPDCPASFATLDSGVLCPLADGKARCLYPEGICACPLPCMAGNATIELEWVCRSWTESEFGCPAIRPPLGSACSQEGQQCAWDGCCYDIPLGPDEACTDAGWTLHPLNSCSCGMPQACNFAPLPIDAGSRDASVDATAGAEPEDLVVSGCACEVTQRRTPAWPLLLVIAAAVARRRRPSP